MRFPARSTSREGRLCIKPAPDRPLNALPSRTMSATSSAPPSPLRQALHLQHSSHRAPSPIRHITNMLPHHHSSSSMYAPSTRAEDIARLLDPAYASGSSSSSASTGSPTRYRHGQARAYVDHHGDLHDPDYRDFPALLTTARAPSAARRRASYDVRPRNPRHRVERRYSGAYTHTRPGWERNWSDVGEDDDDDDDESQSHYSPFASHAATRRSSAFPPTAYQPYISVSGPYSDYTDEPLSSPVDSLDGHSPSRTQESPLYESPLFGDDSNLEHRHKKSRRSSAASAIMERMIWKKAKTSALVGSSEKSDNEHAGQQFSVDSARVDEVYVYFRATQA